MPNLLMERWSVKKCISILTIFCFSLVAPLSADPSSTYIDYQNFNHGYCPTCNCYPCACAPQQYPPPPPPIPGGLPPTGPIPCGAPARGPGPCATCGPCAPCDPCAPVCGTDCGVSICAIAVAVVAVAAAAAIIVASGNGSSTTH